MRADVVTTIVVVVLAAAAGCGDDTELSTDASGQETDAGITAVDGGVGPFVDGCVDVAAHPLFDMTGFVRLIEHSLAAPSVQVRFYDKAPLEQYEVVASAGACTYHRYVPAFCDPACAAGTGCAAGGVCVSWPVKVSAGTVAIEGPETALEVEPGDGAWYVVRGVPDDLFAADDVIRVAAAGAEVDGFAYQVRGVADMATDWDTVVMQDSVDNVVTWTPRGDGAVIELALRTGFHGTPPADIIWCVADEADGQVTVARELVEQFPYSGVLGEFERDSFIRRVSRATRSSTYGPIEVVADSEFRFPISH